MSTTSVSSPSFKPPPMWTELADHAAELAARSDGLQYGRKLFTQPGEGSVRQFQACARHAGEEALNFWVGLGQNGNITPLADWGQIGQGNTAKVMGGNTKSTLRITDTETSSRPADEAATALFGRYYNRGGITIEVYSTFP